MGLVLRRGLHGSLLGRRLLLLLLLSGGYFVDSFLCRGVVRSGISVGRRRVVGLGRVRRLLRRRITSVSSHRRFFHATIQGSRCAFSSAATLSLSGATTGIADLHHSPETESVVLRIGRHLRVTRHWSPIGRHRILRRSVHVWHSHHSHGMRGHLIGCRTLPRRVERERLVVSGARDCR